jgi:hypothetical protein
MGYRGSKSLAYLEHLGNVTRLLVRILLLINMLETQMQYNSTSF